MAEETSTTLRICEYCGVLENQFHLDNCSRPRNNFFENRVTKTVTLSSEDPFEAVIIKMVETNRKKRRDYAGDGHYLSNFYDSAVQLKLSAGHSVETLIATKQSRLKVLLPNYWGGCLDGPSNEPIFDSLLDRAVYSVLAMCIWNEGGYNV